MVGTYKTDEKLQNHPTDFEYISLARTKPHSYLSVVSKGMLGNVVFEVGHITTERNLASISKKKWQMDIR